MHLFPKVASLSAAKIVALSLLVVPMLAAPMLALSILAVSTNPACSKNKSQPTNNEHEMPSQKKNVVVEITKTLQAQADAWNAGDLDKFMTAYLKSPDITFVSADGEMKGYDALESRYRKKYGTSRDTMGKLSFSQLEISSLGDSNALCIGHWLVEPTGKPNLQGIFSLVLTNDAGVWKIIHDHTSLSPTAASN